MENQNQTPHKRRVRYKGKYPKKFEEKYKELQPEKYKDTIEHVIQKGNTPAGMHISIMVKEIIDFLNIQPGEIGFDALSYIVHHPDFEQIPKILETPYIPSPTKEKKSYAPYKYEIAMLRASQFDKNFPDNIIAENEH